MSDAVLAIGNHACRLTAVVIKRHVLIAGDGILGNCCYHKIDPIFLWPEVTEILPDHRDPNVKAAGTVNSVMRRIVGLIIPITAIGIGEQVLPSGPVVIHLLRCSEESSDSIGRSPRASGIAGCRLGLLTFLAWLLRVGTENW